MSLTSGSTTREYIARTSLLVGAFTVVLTISFVGIMAMITGESSGASGRFPWYVFLTSVVFVGIILLMEAVDSEGHLVIRAAITAGALGFVLIVLGGEGIVFAFDQPGDVFNSRLLLYFLSAAVIATGIGYWVLRHWRELGKSSL